MTGAKYEKSVLFHIPVGPKRAPKLGIPEGIFSGAIQNNRYNRNPFRPETAVASICCHFNINFVAKDLFTFISSASNGHNKRENNIGSPLAPCLQFLNLSQ